MQRRSSNPNQAIYVISVAAELAGVHPQTLRVYERKGLLRPQRTAGNTRRYSERDIELLRRIQELTNEGINIAGVLKVLQLEREMARLRDKYERALEEVEDAEEQLRSFFETRNAMALVPLKDIRRVRRALKSDAIDEATRRRTFPTGPVGGDH